MTIEEFKKLTTAEKVEILKQPTTHLTPFFIERIQTALKTNNLSGLMFVQKDLVAIYNEVKPFFKRGVGQPPKYNEKTTTRAFRCPESKGEEFVIEVNKILMKWRIDN